MKRWILMRVICMNCEAFMHVQIADPNRFGYPALMCPLCRGVKLWPVWKDGGPPPRQ